MSVRGPGECTLHARVCSGGIGVFLLISEMRVLLLYRSYSCYHSPLYLDDNGEIDTSKGRNKPMYLSYKRYMRLQELYRNHLIPIEVIRYRMTKTYNVRLDHY